MPVHRYRSAEQMNQPRWRVPGDADLCRAIAGLWAFGARTVPRRFPPGVYRHRTMESLNARTELWSAADFRAFHARRGGSVSAR